MIHRADDHVTLMGRLGGAPEVMSTADGQMLVLNLGVQVVSWTADEASERQTSERTSWHRVVSFNPRVIRHARELERDDIVAVHGYLDQRTYEKDGQQLFVTRFVAEELDPIRIDRMASAVPSSSPIDRRNAKAADMLRITVELLPGGRENGAQIISRGALPISNLADLTKAMSRFGD